MNTEIETPKAAAVQDNGNKDAIKHIASDAWKPDEKISTNSKNSDKNQPVVADTRDAIAPKLLPDNQKITAAKDPLDYVDPMIGTDGHGHTYPGATVPFGMVQLSPDTRRDTWDGCSGYHYSDGSILGFSHTHLSGTGVGDLGDISFMPTTQAVDTNSELDPAKFKASFSHKDESASPGYYSVQIGDIKAELTASKHVGMHRYTFPKGTDSKVIIDLTHGIMDTPTELNFKVVDDHTIVGLRRSSGWANNQYEYFAAKFSKPITGYGISKDHEKPVSNITSAEGKQLSAYLNFDTTDGAPVVAEVALSNVSTDAAMKNLKAEAPPNFDFDKMHEQARGSWRSELGKIDVSTGDDSKARTFYTALYHSMMAPIVVSDTDGGFRGSDSKVHQAKGFEDYSTFSLWDTFRAEQPLMTIIEPNKVNDMVKSLYTQAQYDKNHQLPVWTLDSNETNCMIGYHSFPVIAEAYMKGYREWDAEGMYKYMVENSKRNDWWAEKGYMPSDKERESVSKTLEFAYDDYCLSQFAKALGHNEDAAKFAKWAEAYKNVFDKESGFMRGRLSDGSFEAPFDPTTIGGGGPNYDFTEGNPWQYSFFVPQDVHSMIDMYGGPKPFVDKLDQLFTTKSDGPVGLPDVTGEIGQYAQGNEPSHQIAYLYNYAGAPEKAAEHVKEIRDLMYKDTPAGLCGNDDCGQMSAWYVFSSLGFYPVNPVSSEYIIGTPLFDKASIGVPGGKKFEVLAPGLSDKNIYVQKATLNGKPLNHTYITQEDIMNGGVLELTMTDTPGKWGHDKDASPH